MAAMLMLPLYRRLIDSGVKKEIYEKETCTHISWHWTGCSAGVLRENQVNLQALAGAVAVHRQGHGVAGLHVGNIGGDGAGAGHLGVANGGDDVIGLQARAGGFLAVDLTHQEPGSTLFQAACRAFKYWPVMPNMGRSCT